MGSINRNFSIDVVGVTTFVIFRWRKVSDPGVEIDRRVFGPAPATTNNFSIPDLDAVTYYFDTYISSDGTALTTLLATYTMDIKNSLIINERRFYVIGTGVGNAPYDGDTSLTDSNLDDKTVTGVFQRAFGYLLPTTEWVRTSGGIDLQGTLKFNEGDVYMVEVTHTTEVSGDSGSAQSPFAGIKIITNSLTLDSSYRKQRCKLNGTGSRLVVTMEPIAGIPDGTYFYFVDNDGGAQNQTKIVSSDGTFKWAGNSTAEIWVGKGEWLWFEKQGSNFEVINNHHGLNAIYERFVSTSLSHLNALPEDNTLFDADDWPRVWWFLNNKLTPQLVITDNNLDLGGYTRPVNKDGLFIISPTKKKFRMPDTRKLSDRALSRFDSGGWNIDASRLYDYPGGLQAEMIGPHTHPITVPVEDTSTSDTGVGKFVGGGQGPEPFTMPTFNSGQNIGTENRVKNIGVINFRRI
jgi:hypothetical protein